ncbi:MAG: GNAT family N-acetyltransferase [Lachnospiraceae bacterium]|nr:GNAT family N-acetyltransferase [Lachnospiraceae bacterium]
METVTLRRFRGGDEFAVLPDYQGQGVGRKIVEALEADEYFRRAWRTEVGSQYRSIEKWAMNSNMELWMPTNTVL